MKFVKIGLAGLVILIAVLIVVTPLGPLPGFFIGGKLTPAPASWPDTSATHEIQLRVPGTLPRVVIIWVINHQGELHVVGARDSGWVKMIGASSPVKMRLGNNTYELNARLMDSGWQPVLEAYVAKYRPDYPDIVAGFPAAEDAAGQVAVFRLERAR